jgi:anti-sigma regulatory factor (Ser/Thr protein kinase)
VIRTLSLTNQLSAVDSIREELEEYLASKSVPEETIHTVTLVTEELLVNTISYGYPDTDRLGKIELAICLNSWPSVQLTFRDDAMPFDPLSHPDPEPSEDRIGGWGLPLIRKLCPRATYSRVSDQNILKLEIEPEISHDTTSCGSTVQ